MPAVELKNVSNFICRNIDLKIPNGELMVLLGPTGAGKTTLLNIISGLIRYEGSVLFDGQPVDNIPVSRRNVGYLFQDLALFPHLDVTSNIAYGLKIQKRGIDEIETRLDEMLNLMSIRHLARRYPENLSGGEKQRVALARAIATSPEVLLLDEPMSSLDSLTKEIILDELKSVQQKVGISTIYVTHNQDEAFSLGDRVSILNDGKIEQIDSPGELFHHPKTEFAARFVGARNILRACVIEINRHEATIQINNEGLSQPLKIRVRRYPILEKGKEINLCIHPEKIALNRGSAIVDGKLNRIRGKIVDKTENGNAIKVVVDTDGIKLHAAIPKNLFDFEIYEDVWVCFAPDAPHPLCKRCSVSESHRRCFDR